MRQTGEPVPDDLPPVPKLPKPEAATATHSTEEFNYEYLILKPEQNRGKNADGVKFYQTQQGILLALLLAIPLLIIAWIRLARRWETFTPYSDYVAEDGNENFVAPLPISGSSFAKSQTLESSETNSESDREVEANDLLISDGAESNGLKPHEQGESIGQNFDSTEIADLPPEPEAQQIESPVRASNDGALDDDYYADKLLNANQELRAANRESENRIRELEEALAEASTKLKAAESDREKNAEQIQQLESEAKSTKESIESDFQQTQNLKVQIEELEATLLESLEQNSELEKRLADERNKAPSSDAPSPSELEAKYEALKDSAAEWESEMEALLRQNEKLQQQNNDNKTVREELESSLSRLEYVIERKTNEYESISRRHEQDQIALNDLKFRLKDQSEKLQDQIADLELKLETSQNEKDAAWTEADAERQSVKLLKEELTQLNAALQETQSTHSKLEEIRTAVEAELKQTKEENTDLQQKLDLIEKDNVEFQKVIDDQLLSLTNHQNEIQQLAESISDHDSTLKEEIALRNKVEEEFELLNQQLAERETELSQLRIHDEENAGRFAELENERAGLSSELNALNETISQKEEQHSKEISELRERLDTFQNQLADSEKQLVEANAQKEASESLADEQKKRALELEAELEKTNTELSEREKEVKLAQDRIVQSEKLVEELNSQIQSTASKEEQLVAELTELRDSHQNLECRLEEAKRKLAQADDLHTETRISVELHKKQVSELEAVLEQTFGELTEREAAFKLAQASLAESEERLASNQHKFSELEDQLLQSTEALNSRDKEFNELVFQFNSLNEQRENQTAESTAKLSSVEHELNQKIHELETRLAQSSTSNEELNAALEQATSELQALQNETKLQLENQKSEFEDRLNASESEIQNHVANCQLLEQELAKNKKQIEELELQSIAILDEKETLATQSQQELESQAAAWEAKLARESELANNLSEKLVELETMQKESDATIRSLQVQLEQATNDFNLHEGKHSEDLVASQNQLASALNRVQELESEAQILRDELSVSEQALEDSKSKNVESKEQLATLNHRLEEIEAARRSTESDLLSSVAAREETEANIRAESKEVQTQLNTAIANIEKLTTELNREKQLKRKALKLRRRISTELEVTTIERDGLKQQLKSLSSEFEVLQIRNRQLEKAESELKLAKSNLASLSSQLAAQTNASATQEDIQQPSIAEHQSLQDKVQHLEDKIRLTEVESETLKKQNRRLLATREALRLAQRELNNLNATIGKLERECGKLTETKEALAQQLKESESRNEESQKLHQNANSEIEDLKQQIVELSSAQTELSLLSAKISDLDHQSKTQNNEQDRLLKALKETEEVKTELEFRLQKSEQALRSLEGELESVKNERAGEEETQLALERKLARSRKFIEQLKLTIAEQNQRLINISCGNARLDKKALASLVSLQKNITKKNQQITELQLSKEQLQQNSQELANQLEQEQQKIRILTEKLESYKIAYRDRVQSLSDDYTQKIKKKNALIRKLRDEPMGEIRIIRPHLTWITNRRHHSRNRQRNSHLGKPVKSQTS